MDNILRTNPVLYMEQIMNEWSYTWINGLIDGVVNMGRYVFNIALVCLKMKNAVQSEKLKIWFILKVHEELYLVFISHSYFS